MNAPALLQLIPSSARGGCEGYALAVGREAMTRGWRVHVALPERDSLASLRDDYYAAGVQGHSSGLDIPAGCYQHLPRIVLMRILRTIRVLRRVRPRVVHLVLPWPTSGLGPLLACALLKVPALVVFQLAMDADCLTAASRRAYAWARSRRQQWVAVSRNNRALLSAQFQMPESQIEVIYNGAEQRSGPAAWERQAAREQVCRELSLPAEAPLVLSVGRLAHQKGYDTLIDAAARVIAQVPAAHFAIAGEGPDEPALTAQAQSHGIAEHFHFLGQRRDVPRLLAAADLFVFPTRGEGHPFALLEAMAAGLPVVATSASGIGEIVTAGQDGILVPVHGEAALSTELVRLLREPALRRQLALAAPQTAARFSAEQMLGETFRAFDDLAAPLPKRQLAAVAACGAAQIARCR